MELQNLEPTGDAQTQSEAFSVPVSSSVPVDDDQVQSLRDEIATLKEQLQQREKMHTITMIKEVKPSDYDELKHRCKDLEKKLQKYRSAYALGGISTLSMLIDDYKSLSKKRLSEITNEILAENFDKETITETISFCDYLANIRSEIRAIIGMNTRGKWINNPAYRKIKCDADYITELLSKDSNLIKIDENRYEEFHQLLCNITNVLKEFFNKKGRYRE